MNDESKISSNLTIDARMDAVESNVIITNTNISNLDNSPTRTSDINPIDEIFGTPTINVARGGYIPFMGYLDHRFLWVNIRWESTLRLFQVIQQPVARRLQCNDPRLVDKYKE